MRYLSDIIKYIELVIHSPTSHVLVIRSAPGWAKTHSTRKILNDLKVRYDLLGAYSTPLALYNKLAALADDLKAVLVLDDTSGVLTNPQALSILNACSWPSAEANGLRHVRWTSTTERAAIDGFDYHGKLIVLTNHIPDFPQARAFVNRALNYEIEIGHDLVGELFTEAASSKKHFKDSLLAQKVAEFLGIKAQNYEPGKISLRDLERGYELASRYPSEWQDLLVKVLPRPTLKDLAPEEIILELHDKGSKVDQQASEFQRRTGLGRRKFFYLRQQLGLASEARSQATKVVALSRSRKTRSAELIRN